MTPAKLQIVLLAGAWHTPVCFAKITSLLQDHLYMDLVQDTATARSLLDHAIGNGNDVVFICHSWGGTVAGSALVGYMKEERANMGLKGGVVKVGYMCAFMVDEGKSLHKLTGGEVPSWYNLDLQTHSFHTIQAPTLSASWKTIPSSYLMCEQDLAIPVQIQEMMVNEAKEKGAKIEVSRLDTGHSPSLTMPKETVDWIRGIADEKM
ncbi:alpha/beta-hydrolase [Didymella exigua CBS 183.55]|uniref:Alpha/beta-hydrolase n=1 Tax=Didymella exigua CBS 183.55 TaxID=1150837 RepID=A0A6A5RE83_9PLEO|nr:alpha/beta-hydrolase [Didymella exigua CBS 183.55]KAF1926611.1 alpha/beta-hydrolase [Didymella exigua CBS 183.55]